MTTTTDYGRPERKQPSLHGRKFTPTPKFLGTAETYFVCHIGPNFHIALIYAFIGCAKSMLYCNVLFKSTSCIQEQIHFELSTSVLNPVRQYDSILPFDYELLFNLFQICFSFVWIFRRVVLPEKEVKNDQESFKT